MKEIASPQLYSIAVDQAKNRVRIGLRGSWVKREDYPNWITDHDAALKYVNPGFTIVADVTDVKGSLDTTIVRVHRERRFCKNASPGPPPKNPMVLVGYPRGPGPDQHGLCPKSV
ncbi:hypothetical protein ACFL2Q_06535 [Thermodesulfobacteriota bacterium]